MNAAELQMLKALRTTSFNNALIAEQLKSFADMVPGLTKELWAMAAQLELDADMLEDLVTEIDEGRIVRSS